jgi:hypothetical protein
MASVCSTNHVFLLDPNCAHFLRIQAQRVPNGKVFLRVMAQMEPNDVEAFANLLQLNKSDLPLNPLNRTKLSVKAAVWEDAAICFTKSTSTKEGKLLARKSLTLKPRNHGTCFQTLEMAAVKSRPLSYFQTLKTIKP